MNIYKIIGKRIFDILICVISIILLFPVFILVSILIFAENKGPILFFQKRAGKNAEEFFIIKFRSMPVETESLASDQLSNTKLSKIGSFIRRTNIDELPQIFNVLLNEMSIVGPRPPLLSQKKLIEIRKLNGSINCTPGITGLAQVNSYDGMVVEKKAELDGIYAKKISFFYDIKIILKTFLYLLKPPPKY